MKKLIHQQGDVLLYASEIPADAKRVDAKAGRYVLAEGEATGHAHAIADSCDIELFERANDAGVVTLYLRVREGTLTHEEHGAQVLTPGDYEVGRVVEVDPFAGEVRRVTD